MNAWAPTPIEITDRTVTLSRADWEQHLDRLEALSDGVTVALSIAEQARLGDSEFKRLTYTAAEVDRLIAGESVIVIWRDRLNLSQRQLARDAGISPSYLAEIEGGKKPGSAGALSAVAKVLRVPMEHLVD